jgi:hypothetical protein
MKHGQLFPPQRPSPPRDVQAAGGMVIMSQKEDFSPNMSHRSSVSGSTACPGLLSFCPSSEDFFVDTSWNICEGSRQAFLKLKVMKFFPGW